MAVDYLRECSGVICALTSLHISNLLPTFEAAVRFHREVQQVVHRDFSDSVDTRDTVGLALVAIHLGHCGNLSPNMGKPLFDCSRVASS
jgi:hypothetical protein